MKDQILRIVKDAWLSHGSSSVYELPIHETMDVNKINELVTTIKQTPALVTVNRFKQAIEEEEIAEVLIEELIPLLWDDEYFTEDAIAYMLDDDILYNCCPNALLNEYEN